MPGAPFAFSNAGATRVPARLCSNHTERRFTMTLINMLVGLPMMMLCLLVQTTSAFWSVRHYVRRTERLGAGGGFFASTRPLLSAMIIMMTGNFVQIVLWGV